MNETRARIVSLIAVAIALWAGIHAGHAIDDPTMRHVGEAVALLLLAVLVMLLSHRRRGKTSHEPTAAEHNES